MRSAEAQIGKQVRVGEGSGLPPELQGLTGTLSGKWANPWGPPEDLVLEVRLESGRTQLFWNHELEKLTPPKAWWPLLLGGDT